MLKPVVRFVLILLYRVQIHGLEHYYQAGNRVLIIANHTSFLDAVLLAVFLPDTHTGEQLVLLTEYRTATRQALVERFKLEGVSILMLPKTIPTEEDTCN
ncbi:MAG: 1-acyl-sn-glycerol-3-phosphate acyltransferase [Deltaproteobacteria bacterium]|nr:1-acyl-sn-glycerol-3-phosphate acyltransferase [Deltaproteobacteria bacterium]